MLIEHLKADDMALRVVATRSLPAIADALGPDRVREELIPFINESTDDEDEVLLRITFSISISISINSCSYT